MLTLTVVVYIYDDLRFISITLLKLPLQSINFSHNFLSNATTMTHQKKVRYARHVYGDGTVVFTFSNVVFLCVFIKVYRKRKFHQIGQVRSRYL